MKKEAKEVEPQEENNEDISDSEESEAEEVDPVSDEESFNDSIIPLGIRKRKRPTSNIKEAKVTEQDGSRVVYLGRIPHGFYESQMNGFFSQFGDVVRLRLSRNKKTGKSKHYAFIEFEYPEVAQKVAETMHKYRLYGHSLQCKVIPKDKIHPRMFIGAGKPFRVIPWKRIALQEHNKPKTPQEVEMLAERLVKKETAKRRKLQELGIDYDFPGFAAQVKPKPKHKVFS